MFRWGRWRWSSAAMVRGRAIFWTYSVLRRTRCISRWIARCGNEAALGEVCHRGAGTVEHFGIRLEFRLTEARGWYAFTIGGQADGSYVVRREECRVSSEGSEVEAFFQVENGRCVATSLTYAPVTDSGLLYLVRVASASEFRPVYQALCDMGFYHIDPRRLGGFHARTGETDVGGRR